MGIDQKWLEIAKSQLLNKKIVNVRYMTDAEAKKMGWRFRCVVMQLDDGNLIFPSSDDEGNNAGAIATTNEANPVLPVLDVT
jgi:hypothetical protein